MNNEENVHDMFKFIYELFTDLEKNQFNVNNWDLKNEGEIFYFNGLNGSKHDWFVNGHMPSFATLYEDGTECIKVHIYSDGNIKAYYYKEGSKEPDETVQTEIEPEAAKDLAVILYAVSDAKGLYDKRIRDLDQFYNLTDADFEEFEKQN